MKRDKNIQKSYQREIKMTESVVKSKKTYTRKAKHKKLDKGDVNEFLIRL